MCILIKKKYQTVPSHCPNNTQITESFILSFKTITQNCLGKQSFGSEMHIFIDALEVSFYLFPPIFKSSAQSYYHSRL